MTYRLTCAGCSKVFRFRNMERIGLRVRQHRCQPVASVRPLNRTESQERVS